METFELWWRWQTLLIEAFSTLAFYPVYSYYFYRLNKMGESLVYDAISIWFKHLSTTDFKRIGINGYLFYDILILINIGNLVYRYDTLRQFNCLTNAEIRSFLVWEFSFIIFYVVTGYAAVSHLNFICLISDITYCVLRCTSLYKHRHFYHENV